MKKTNLGMLDFIEFVKKYGREPSKDEFMNLGYCRSWYYAIRKSYRENEKELKGDE